MRCEPRSPGLLRDALAGLAALWAPQPPPRLQAARHVLAARALAGESPVWTHAVVFRTCRPVRMDINGGIDYDLFAAPWQAARAMAREQSEAFADPELWERDGGGWHPAA